MFFIPHKMFLKLILSFLTIVFASLIANCTLSSCTQKDQKTEKVRIAFNIPLTGTFGIYGQAIRDGALLALKDLKNIYPNVNLIVDFQDNKGKPSDTVTIMQKQFFKPVDIYVSGVKPQTMAIFDQVKEKGIPHFVWVFDAFICANNSNTFRTWVSFKYEPEKYLQFIECEKPQKIAIVYVNVPHVIEEMEEIVIPSLKKLDYEDKDLMIEVYDWSRKDFKDIVAKIRRFSPDLTIMSGFQGNIVGLTKLMRSYSIMEQSQIISTFDMIDAANVLSQDELEGIRFITPLFNVEKETKRIEAWKNKFEDQYGRKPLYTAAYSYDMMYMISEAAKKIQGPMTSKAWVKALHTTELQGVTGDLEFDKDGDLEVDLKIGVFRNGTICIDKCNSYQLNNKTNEIPTVNCTKNSSQPCQTKNW